MTLEHAKKLMAAIQPFKESLENAVSAEGLDFDGYVTAPLKEADKYTRMMQLCIDNPQAPEFPMIDQLYPLVVRALEDARIHARISILYKRLGVSNVDIADLQDKLLEVTTHFNPERK